MGDLSGLSFDRRRPDAYMRLPSLIYLSTSEKSVTPISDDQTTSSPIIDPPVN